MTLEELKIKADELGRRVAEKKRELMTSHWNNMAMAFGVPEGGSVDEALNNDLYFINGDHNRTKWFASWLIREVGVNGDRDPSHFKCVGSIGHLMCGALYDTCVFLRASAENVATKECTKLIDNMEFTDNFWSRGWGDYRGGATFNGKMRYRERFDDIRVDFSDAKSEAGLSEMFTESVYKLNKLKMNLKIRDELYPHLHRTVEAMRAHESVGSKAKIDSASKALDLI